MISFLGWPLGGMAVGCDVTGGRHIESPKPLIKLPPKLPMMLPMMLPPKLPMMLPMKLPPKLLMMLLPTFTIMMIAMTLMIMMTLMITMANPTYI